MNKFYPCSKEYMLYEIMETLKQILEELQELKGDSSNE